VAATEVSRGWAATSAAQPATDDVVAKARFGNDGSTITEAGNNNVSYFNDPAYNRRFAAAAKLTGAARYRYAQLDADLTRNAAPWFPVSNSLVQAFYSARVGCQQFAPAASSNTDLAALYIRSQTH
jgi:hypothetical protein